MSIIVRVSYQNDDELQAIQVALKNMLPVCEIAEQKGIYKRAYLKEKGNQKRRKTDSFANA